MSDETEKSKVEAAPLGEPTAGDVEPSVWMIFGLIVLAWVAMMFLDRRGGGFNAEVYRPYPSHAFVKDISGPTKPASYTEGESLYLMVCAGCHQTSGGGATGVAPKLTGSEWVLEGGPDRLARIIYNGVKGPIEVDGEVFNPGGQMAMLPMGQQMGWGAKEVAAVITYLRGNADWGHELPEVTAAEVEDAVAKSKSRKTQWTESELKAIPLN